MIHRMRGEYERAWIHLTLLQECLGRMEEIGIAQPWSWALRADVSRLSRSMQAAMAAAERQRSTPHGPSTAEQDPAGADARPEESLAIEDPKPGLGDAYLTRVQYASACPSTAPGRSGQDRRRPVSHDAVITIHQDRKVTSESSSRPGRHRQRP